MKSDTMSKVLWFHRHVQVFPIKFAKFRFRSSDLFVLSPKRLLLFCYLSISLVGSSQEMLTSLLAFEIIENSFSCRKIASYPVYKLSVVI